MTRTGLLGEIKDAMGEDPSQVIGILEVLEQECYSVAEHLESNWQDRAAAKSWMKAGKAIDAARAKVWSSIT